IQADTESNAPLKEWLERHALASAPQLWQKLRIDPGWETAVEAVLRERLHARQSDPVGERPPAKASLFVAARDAGRDGLIAKIHVLDEAVSGALADWLAGVLTCEGTPDAEARARLGAGEVLVNRAGDQFTRHTVSLHAPDAADAGLLARQAEIEALEGRCAELRRKLEQAQAEHARAQSESAEREAALEEARGAIARHERARHEAQIELLKLGQAQERHRERHSQLAAERDSLEAEAAEAARALAASAAAAARIGEEIEAARAGLEAARAEHERLEAALAAQRQAVQEAEREAQDALFGERECASKIAEIDHSVRVIDQQIERADQEVARLTEELAADPIPAVRALLEAAVEARISREKL